MPTARSTASCSSGAATWARALTSVDTSSTVASGRAEDRVIGGDPVEPVMNFRIDGETRPLEFGQDDRGDGRFCPQQILVRNLIDVFVSDGGDLRFGVDVSRNSRATAMSTGMRD